MFNVGDLVRTKTSRGLYTRNVYQVIPMCVWREQSPVVLPIGSIPLKRITPKPEQSLYLWSGRGNLEIYDDSI